MCLSCICLLAMHTLICVTFSLFPGVGGWLRLLRVALLGLFCLTFMHRLCTVCNSGCVICTHYCMFICCSNKRKITFFRLVKIFGYLRYLKTYLSATFLSLPILDNTETNSKEWPITMISTIIAVKVNINSKCQED